MGLLAIADLCENEGISTKIINHPLELALNPKFSLEDLNKVYQEEIVGQDSRRFFDTFERHFKRYGKRKPGAFAILKELADAGDNGIDRKILERIHEK